MSEILVNVEVTKKDIQHGTIQDCSDCPVARAISNILKTEYHARVGTTHFRVIKSSDLTQNPLIFDLPLVVGSFIRRFDADGDVQPFSFSIFLPEELVKNA